MKGSAATLCSVVTAVLLITVILRLQPWIVNGTNGGYPERRNRNGNRDDFVYPGPGHESDKTARDGERFSRGKRAFIAGRRGDEGECCHSLLSGHSCAAHYCYSPTSALDCEWHQWGIPRTPEQKR